MYLYWIHQSISGDLISSIFFICFVELIVSLSPALLLLNAYFTNTNNIDYFFNWNNNNNNNDKKNVIDFNKVSRIFHHPYIHPININFVFSNRIHNNNFNSEIFINENIFRCCFCSDSNQNKKTKSFQSF